MFWSSWQAYLLVEFLQNFGLFLGTVLGDREMFFSYSYDVCWWHSYLFPLISEIELQLNLELINLSEWLSTNKLILNFKEDWVHGFWHPPETMSPRHRWGSYNVGRRICDRLWCLQVPRRSFGQQSFLICILTMWRRKFLRHWGCSQELDHH